ncbi:MAG: hypothetical protein KAG66_12870, partial [Methylococcales bacterium]|nr:hypothetical protein [Methylococcales bacterium]
SQAEVIHRQEGTILQVVSAAISPTGSGHTVATTVIVSPLQDRGATPIGVIVYVTFNVSHVLFS